MRRLILTLLCLLSGGCFLGPSVEHVSRHTCFTQPRTYCTPAGVCHQEVDSYTQAEPCPAELIK